jgi:hypothetical protein
MLSAAAIGTILGKCTWEVKAMLKTIITWAIVIFIIYYLATDPTGSAHILHDIYTLLTGAAHSLAKFISSL